MVRAVDKADAIMLTLSSALYYRKPFTIYSVYCMFQEVFEVSTWNEVVCCCVFIVHWAYLLVVILRCVYEKRDIMCLVLDVLCVAANEVFVTCNL